MGEENKCTMHTTAPVSLPFPAAAHSQTPPPRRYHITLPSIRLQLCLSETIHSAYTVL